MRKPISGRGREEIRSASSQERHVFSLQPCLPHFCSGATGGTCLCILHASAGFLAARCLCGVSMDTSVGREGPLCGTGMRSLLLLWLAGTICVQQEIPGGQNRCDGQRSLRVFTPCTSCAIGTAAVCPPGFIKTARNSSCSYLVHIGENQVYLPGCQLTCQKLYAEPRCCSGFWGPACLPCPTWSGRVCNGHGSCVDGNAGNGSCVCDEGFTGGACQMCKNKHAYGEQCHLECSCVRGECNSGPSGDGECYCQPPYTGPKCDRVTPSCVNCTAYTYCKEEGGVSTCQCLPSFKKTGSVCTGACASDTCGPNTKCTYMGSRNFKCLCESGYEGDGKVCRPTNPCTVNNGDCPADSTNCVYVQPGKSTCQCKAGMERAPGESVCTLVSACKPGVCHPTARCQTGQDGLHRCVCGVNEIEDGRRCYGNIMERILELDRSSDYKGKLSGAIALFERCQLAVRKHGPFTALVPLNASSTEANMELLCKHHLILGQHLLKDLPNSDFWTLGGEAIRFRETAEFRLLREPDKLYKIMQGNLAASNGIIHILDEPITNVSPESDSEQQVNKTIGEIVAQDSRFNRFLSLVDNCGTRMPLRGPGPLTVFVPSNEAIDRFRDGSVIYMLTDAQHKLQEFLKHHMFSKAVVTVEQLASMSELQTMANQIIHVSISEDGRVHLGDKGVLLQTTNIMASNGIIHQINGVLVPPSIVPILPHRCDVTEAKIAQGACVLCSRLAETHCPPGSAELERHVKDCEYQASPTSSLLSDKGCAKLCNSTRTRAECCSGFYGPDCKPCIGGFQNPCYGKGKCAEGIGGNGTCICAPGFEGVACHICADETKHGENCDEDCRCVHGVCDNRPGSVGVCRRSSCQDGFYGELCDKTAAPCNADGAYEICHIHAYCTVDPENTCVCKPGYAGDGHTCAPVDTCLQASRGGCDTNAQCLYNGPGNVSCVCNEGWTGDGLVCVEIDNCLQESGGGCDPNALCINTGPGQNECICKPSYMGDGITCDYINPCLSNNGGCHRRALCKPREDGTAECTCNKNYGGDGVVCYGTILNELSANTDFSLFNSLLKRWMLLDLDVDLTGNTTALVPSADAFNHLSDEENELWTDPYRLPYFLQVHLLNGAFSYKDLEKLSGQEVATLHSKTKWGITNATSVMIGSASILIPDIPATNGFIHIINMVLTPRLSDVPPVPPSLTEFLNSTPAFSLFSEAAKHYNLTGIIGSKKFTILMPSDDAIREHKGRTNTTQLDEETFKYHVILYDRLFPEHLGTGIIRSTSLGSSYKVMFYTDANNETLVNDVHLSGIANETRDGYVIGIPRVLEVHKNLCNKEITLKVKGKCGSCKSAPRCSFNYKPVMSRYPDNMPTNCRYRRRFGKRSISVSGCITDCVKQTEDHACCPGYFGYSCYKCPGKLGQWCSNNGQCQDGVNGNGECLCREGFHGTACEDCEPGRYGKDCKSVCSCSHGKCVDGMEGSGKCVCYKGWKGVNCSVEVVDDACGGVCDENANCVTDGPGGKPTCVCVAGYNGNGTSCQEINSCAVANGGCSEHADCMNTAPGVRRCSCREGYTGDGMVCVEINHCLQDNGGCSPDAQCVQTGPNLVTCICNPGYSGNGKLCLSINPCWMSGNGGCSYNAKCEQTGPGTRNCTCRSDFIGDGFTCRGSTYFELQRHEKAAWLRANMQRLNIVDLFRKGPFTLFVPVQNSTDVTPGSTNLTQAHLRYYIVGCKRLLLSQLQSINDVVSMSGYSLHFSVQQDDVFINGKSKIISSDFITSNGVLHFIDKMIIPEELNNKSAVDSSKLNVTAAAEAHGYTTFSKLLQDAGLLEMVKDKRHHPFTMLWPSDAAFNALPEEQKRWLYSEDHRDKLAAYMKAHIVRNNRIYAAKLDSASKIRTMYGSTLSFICGRKTPGDVLIDELNVRIVERHLEFDAGVAHGIDRVLEPPNVGAHCDDFQKDTFFGPCMTCLTRIPYCPFNSAFTGKTVPCNRRGPGLWTPYRRSTIFYQDYSSLFLRNECKATCERMAWKPKCCKNHYGDKCHVCPGGLESPCSNHGTCADGIEGNGACICQPGSTGTVCELCRSGYYGPNCTACSCSPNGKCADGMDGDGSCFCAEGWTGTHCNTELADTSVCEPECHPKAVCQAGNTCECEPQYEGDGRTCTAPDLCSEDNSGCHQHANCSQAELNVTCTCWADYEGDGYVCIPIDLCKSKENGDCSEFANCIVTGPNERRCECLPGYVGNGVQCLEQVVPPVDRCLEENGGCDPKADCKDLHFHENTAGVFHLRSPAGRYQLTYAGAQLACEEQRATLATFNQLSDAQQLGMHNCVAGWMEDKQVGYPVRFPSAKCGNNHVGVVVYKNPVDVNGTYDAYCYRVKDVSCDCGTDYTGDGYFCNGDLASVVATNANFSAFYSMLLDNDNASADGEGLMALLSSKSSRLMLLVPHNSGFYGNETLSRRDVTYHISANNSVHLYRDLAHGSLIPSHLGFNLSVSITSDEAALDPVAVPYKRVDRRRIIDWDIPTTNGIIHVIEGPLKAPPPPAKPVVSAATAQHSSATVTGVLLSAALLAALAGTAYYFLKHKKDAFRFQYFKDEEDDGESPEGNPTLVSIPNPLYSGSRAFAHPFADLIEKECSDVQNVLN